VKILLVEDDRATSALISDALTNCRYILDVTADGRSGLDLAISWDYDLILLDLLVPQMDGISLCRELRRQGEQVPILLLTAKNSNSDIIKGLDAGADDYVTKPFELSELMARIRALLRRRQAAVVPSVLTWGDLHLNPVSAEVTYKKQSLSLSPKEYSLLELFLRHPQQVFSRSAIIDRLWSIDDCPSEGAVTNLIKDLRHKLKAAGVTADILKTVYGLGYRLQASPETQIHLEPLSERGVWKEKPTAESRENCQAGLASVRRVMERYQDTFAEQVSVLKQAEQALLRHNLSFTLQQSAIQETHKLAGGLGTFGYLEGSKLARQIEDLLTSNIALEQAEIFQFSQLIVKLQQELAKSPILLTTETTSLPQSIHGLIVDDDAILAERLQEEMLTWGGMQLEIALDVTTVKQKIAQTSPDFILLDLCFPNSPADGLILLQELTEQFPAIPVLALTARDNLETRVAVSRAGGCGFLSKPILPEQIFEAIAQVLSRTQTANASVMVLESEPTMLQALSGMLQPWGIQVTSLQESTYFWKVLTATKPDLLVLDWEIPIINGFDLCRVIRQDSVWGNLPILVTTVCSDAETIEQIFAVGADDFISKPVVGSDFVTRVLSRIERSQLRKRLEKVKKQEKQVLYRLATVDPLTQLANRFFFDRYFNQEWQRLRREQAPLTLLLCNIDDCIDYNDCYGRQAGVACLKQIASAIQEIVKHPADLVARYSGEEFAVLLSNTDVAGAIYVVEQIQTRVAQTQISHACQVSNYVTISIGIACTVPTADSVMEGLVAAAERSLDAAKSKGGNTYCYQTL